MHRGAPTQVAHRRSSEWDSFVNTQSICEYSGDGAGLRQDLLRGSRTREDWENARDTGEQDFAKDCPQHSWGFLRKWKVRHRFDFVSDVAMDRHP